MNRLGLALLALVFPLAAAATESWREPRTGLAFIKIEQACYDMGSPTPVEADPGGVLKRHPVYTAPLSVDEVPVHRVCLSPFWIGQHEVRISDWNAVMDDIRPLTGNDPAQPVHNVSWQEARAFAARLSELSGEQFRLPTEAEWEHACRAGFEEPVLATGGELTDQAWYNRGKARRTESQPVAQLEPNPFGLYDMLGNVWEWVEDSYTADAYARHAAENPLIREAGAPAVIRGGSFRTEPRQTRCTKRGKLAADIRLTSVGFRLVKEYR